MNRRQIADALDRKIDSSNTAFKKLLKTVHEERASLDLTDPPMLVKMHKHNAAEKGIDVQGLAFATLIMCSGIVRVCAFSMYSYTQPMPIHGFVLWQTSRDHPQLDCPFDHQLHHEEPMAEWNMWNLEEK